MAGPDPLPETVVDMHVALDILVKVFVVLTAVWAGMRYVLEPQVARIVGRVIKEREQDASEGRARDVRQFAQIYNRLTLLEANMQRHNTDAQLAAQTLVVIAKAVERIADKSDETATAVASQGAVINMIRDSLGPKGGAER